MTGKGKSGSENRFLSNWIGNRCRTISKFARRSLFDTYSRSETCYFDGYRTEKTGTNGKGLRAGKKPLKKQESLLLYENNQKFVRKNVCNYDRKLPDEAHAYSTTITDPSWLADMIATTISLPTEQRREILFELNPTKGLKLLNQFWRRN
jgi:hypothetical protein